MNFSVLMGLFSWINGFVWMYWVIDIMQLDENLFWLMLGVTHLVNGAGYFWRAKILTKNAPRLALVTKKLC